MIQPGTWGATWSFFAVVASSPLILGAFLGARHKFPERLLAAVLAFAAGAVITALTFELFEESFEKGGAIRAALGLAVGAVVFTGASLFLDRYVAGDDGQEGSDKLDKDATASERSATKASVSGAAGLALLAAVTLDGVPENAALGITLNEGVHGHVKVPGGGHEKSPRVASESPHLVFVVSAGS